MSQRRKLVFFAAADPGANPRVAWSAYHFADVAAGAGLEAEVRLAGDAVLVAKPEAVEASPVGRQLLEKARAGPDAPYLVSL